MDKKVEFLFYLAAIVCFVLAALQDSGRMGGRSLARVALVPIGLALVFFPLMWNTGAAAF